MVPAQRSLMAAMALVAACAGRSREPVWPSAATTGSGHSELVVSVKRRPDGGIHVDEAWLAADAGTVVNPERARGQMEGAVIFGISHALYGGVLIKRGATQQSNFHDYRLLRIGEMPTRTHVELLSSTQLPGGIGEPGVPPVAPAVANAVFALTGKRLRELPLRLDRLGSELVSASGS